MEKFDAWLKKNSREALWDWQFIVADAGAGKHYLKNSELYHMQCESLYVAKLRSPWWCLSRWIIIRSNCLIENSDRSALTVGVHTFNLCIFVGVGHCKEFPATTLVEGPVNKSDSLRQALRSKNNRFPFTVLADCVVENVSYYSSNLTV